MSAHTKVSEIVYSEYDCSIKDCYHDECPTERMGICQECSQESWEQNEGGVVTWMECLDNLALDEFDRPADVETGIDK